MPAADKKVLRIEVDSRSVSESIANVMREIWNKPLVQTAAQVAAFGGAAYVGAQFLTSAPGQKIGSWVGSAGGFVRDAVGFSPYDGPRAMRGNLLYPTISQRLSGEPEGYSGRNLLVSEGIYYGYRDMAQRVGAGLGGFLAGAVPSLATLGLIRSGLLSPLSSTFQTVGSSIGGGLFGGGIGLIGRALAAPLGWLGLEGAQNAVLSVMGPAGLIAQGGAKVGGALGGFFGMTMPWIIASTLAMRVGEAVVENIATQRQIEDWIDQTSYRYTYGGASNTILGRGFDYRTQRDIAQSVRKTLMDHTFMRQTDFQEIFRGIQMSELDFNVRSAEEFKEKFAKVTEVLVDIARTFETTLEGAAQMLGMMQRSGFYSTVDQVAMLWRNNAIARHSGMTAEEVIQVGLSGAEQASHYGVSRSLGSSFRTSALSRLSLAPSYLEGEEKERYVQYLYELGGAETVSGELTDIMIRTMLTNTPAQLALYALADTENLRIDPDMMRRFQAGELNLIQLMEIGGQKATANQRAFEKFLNESRLYLGELEGQEAMEFFRQIVLLQHAQTPSQDIATTLATHFDIQNPMLRYVVRAALFGSEMRSESAMQLDEIIRLTMNQEALNRTPRGWWERNIAKPLSRLGQLLGGEGITSWFMQISEDFQNEFIYQIDKINITRDDLSLEGIRSARTMILTGERIRDVLPTEHQTQKIVQEIAEAIEEAIQTSLGKGDLGRVVELENAKSKVEELEEVFNRLFREFESGKITVENFTNSYNAAIKELGGISAAQGLAAGGAIAGITQALDALGEGFAKHPVELIGAYEAANQARVSGLHRLASQFATGNAGGGNPAVDALIESLESRNYRLGGKTGSEMFFSLGVNALSPEEYALLEETLAMQGYPAESLVYFGLIPLEEGDLTPSERALLDEIFADPELRRKFINIKFVDQGAQSVTVQRFIQEAGPDGVRFYPLFKKFEKLEEEGKFKFNTAYDDSWFSPQAARFSDLQSMFRKTWTIGNTLGLDYAGTLEARRKLAEDLVQEAGGIGGFDPEALEVVREFVINPFQEKIIGTPEFFYIEFVMDTQGFVDALAEIGITDTNEVEKYVELWGKTVGAGMKTGAYGGNINLSTRPLSVVAAEALEQGATAWLRDLAKETGAPGLGRIRDISAILRDTNKRSILRRAYDVVDPTTGGIDSYALRQLLSEVGDDPDMIALVNAIAMASLDPEQREAGINRFTLLEQDAVLVGFYSVSDRIRHTLGSMAAGLEKRAEDILDPALQKTLSDAAGRLRAFSTQTGMLDLTPLHDASVIEAMIAGNYFRTATVLTQSKLAADDLAKVDAGELDFVDARDAIIRRMIENNVISSELVEKTGLGSIMSKSDFSEAVASIFHELIANEWAQEGTTAIPRNMDQDLLGENIVAYMHTTRTAVAENGRVMHDLNQTLQIFESTMRDLNTTMNRINDKLLP